MFQRETNPAQMNRRKFLTLFSAIPSTPFLLDTPLAFGVLLLSRDTAPRVPAGVYLHSLQPRLAPGALPLARGSMRTTLIAEERECAEQLARFFPKLPAVRIPVRVAPQRPGQRQVQEATVVEYGTAEFAIFLSKLALEFDDRVRLVRDGGGRSAEAAVIALQYHEGRKAVAVRFLDRPCEWMMCP
jgi:hypothetical protein